MSAVLKKTNELPEGWSIASIGDVAEDTQIGIVRSKALQNVEGKGAPYLKMNNVTMGGLVTTDDLVYVEVSDEELERYTIQEGDILFNTRNSSELVGKTGYANKNVSGFVYNNNLMRIRTKEGIDSKYIAYQMVSPVFRNDMEKVKRATTNIAAVYAKDLLPLPIYLAPPEQQKRIVAKIEELFSHIDAGIEALKKAKLLLKQYRQSVLKAAVTGELTKEWREANKDKLEPASQLLDVIEKQRCDVYEEELNKWNILVKDWGKFGNKEKKPAKPKKLKNIEQLNDDDIEELHSLPDGWLWVKLSQVATKITDGEHFKPPVQDDGVYFLSAKDVRDEGVSFDNPLYISEETAEKALLRCNPEKGDILIVSRGATVGRMCVVNTDQVFCLLGSVILIKVAKGINSEYLMNLMKSPDINRKVSNVSGATAQQAIYLRDIQHVAIPLCSIEEQKEIDRVVNEKNDAIMRLENEIDSKLVMAEKNKQSILASAFSGSIA